MEIIITCPSCGAEYLPAEIFYPNDFFGSPKDIQKDFRGKIQFYRGTSVSLTESYTCDYCKRKMYITADLDFDSQTQPFTNGHVTKFRKTNLFMNED